MSELVTASASPMTLFGVTLERAPGSASTAGAVPGAIINGYHVRAIDRIVRENRLGLTRTEVTAYIGLMILAQLMIEPPNSYNYMMYKYMYPRIMGVMVLELSISKDGTNFVLRIHSGAHSKRARRRINEATLLEHLGADTVWRVERFVASNRCPKLRGSNVLRIVGAKPAWNRAATKS